MSPDKKSAAARGKPRGSSVKKLGHFKLEKKVGEGGMGAVYRAVDNNLGRIVALKVLPRDKAQNDLMVKRFQAEARAAANLRHENIVGVYDSGEADGYLYIAMEFVDGIDVQELLIRKGLLSPKRSLDIIKQVTRALIHAYEQNIVHRDIKPSNLMIMRDGSVKLADMGLARSLSESENTGITRAGTTVGTVDYMSPEQARDSRSANCRSDIYSLGATWFYMLTGQPPFPDGDILNKITAHAVKPRPNPQSLNGEIPDAISELIERMMAIEPTERFQTPAALLEDLETANLSARAITSDLLAALADGDDEDEIPESRPAAKPPSHKLAPKYSAAERAGSGSASEIRRTAKKKKTPPQKEAAKNNSDRPRDAASSGTSADKGSTSAIPSARDAMLGGKRLRRKYREGGGGGFEMTPTIKIAAIVVGLALVIVVGNMALSAISGDDATPQVPTLDSDGPDSGNSDNGSREEPPPPAPIPDRSTTPGTLPRKLPGRS